LVVIDGASPALDRTLAAGHCNIRHSGRRSDGAPKRV
jgi:hypothetical protein